MTQRRLTTILLGVLVACLLGGAVGAYLLGRQDAEAAATASSAPPTASGGGGSVTGSATVSGTASPSGTATAAQGTRANDVTATAAPGPTPDEGTALEEPDSSELDPSSAPLSDGSDDAAPLPPGKTTGADRSSGRDTTVRLAGVARDDPNGPVVLELIQRHFDGINSRSYKLWASTVSRDQVEAIDPGRWLEDYRTTIDTDISVILITDDPREVQLTFRSRQAPDKAPDGKSTCLNWVITLPLIVEGGELVLGTSAGDRARWTSCYSN